jgi:predicted Fe-Mo cluster-binding NifX family protein
MKIAITCTKNEIDADVDQRFGRAPYFLIYNIDDDSFEFIENTQSLNLPQGAGVQAVKTVLDKGVNAVLTGHCGPNAFTALSKANIKIFLNVKGTLKDAFQAFKNRQLEEATTPDVEGHWV